MSWMGHEPTNRARRCRVCLCSVNRLQQRSSRVCGQYRACSGADHRRRIGNHCAAMAVARKAEIGSRVLTQQREISGMRAVRHRERAALMFAGFGKSYLCTFPKSDVPQVNFLRNAAGGGEAGDQAVEAHRCIELEVPSGVREGDSAAAGRAAARPFRAGPVQLSQARSLAAMRRANPPRGRHGLAHAPGARGQVGSSAADSCKTRGAEF
jgi:hypothetical protein